MYRRNMKLPTIPIKGGMTPLEMAIWLRKRKMAESICEITDFKVLEEEKIIEIFLDTIHTDMYDVSLKILKEKIDESLRVLLYAKIKFGESALKLLAQKPLLDNHSIQGWIWEGLVSIISTIPYIPYFRRTYTSLQMRRQATQLVKELWKQIVEVPNHETLILKLVKNKEIFHDAAKIGNAEFFTLLSNSYPDLRWMVNEERHSILHIAVINRLEEVISLLYPTGVWKEASSRFIDYKNNNILHLAGRLAPPSRLDIASGAALQMQKELQWFKAMEKIVRSSYVQMKNEEGQKPRELFTKDHEMLRDAGEKWMKGIATSCMVMAALIVTVVFAAAFTVPGGYKEEKGAPIFLNYGWFTIFVISDVVAMFSSTASIMTFLSLFTAQYREDDFLSSLPTKLMVGLVTLFASIVCMVLTFTAAFFLAYKEENQGTLPKFVAAFAGLPITLYALLNNRLWISLIYSTFFTSRFMFRPEKHILSLADPIWINVKTLVSTNSPDEFVHERSQL